METNESKSAQSSVPALARKEFVKLTLKRGAIAGAILAAPAIIDKFMIPPVHAAGMSSGTGGESGMSGMEP